MAIPLKPVACNLMMEAQGGGDQTMSGDRILGAVADGERIHWRGRASGTRILGWKWRHLAIGLLLIAVAADLIPLIGSGSPDYGPGIDAPDADFVASVAAALDLVVSVLVGIVGVWILVGVADTYVDEAGREYAVTDRRVISATRTGISSTALGSIVTARSSRTSFGAGVEALLTGRGAVLRLAGIPDPESAIRAMGGASGSRLGSQAAQDTGAAP